MYKYKTFDYTQNECTQKKTGLYKTVSKLSFDELLSISVPEAPCQALSVLTHRTIQVENNFSQLDQRSGYRLDLTK